MDAVLDLSYSTVATAPSPATSGLSLVLAAGGGALMPAVPFDALVWAAGAIPTTTNSERVVVTALSTDTPTIVRGGSPRTIVIGDQFAAIIDSRMLQELAGLQQTQGTDSIQAGYGRYVVDAYEVINGQSLEILNGGTLEVG